VIGTKGNVGAEVDSNTEDAGRVSTKNPVLKGEPENVTTFPTMGIGNENTGIVVTASSVKSGSISSS
jgi:hypothetical protein